MDATTYRDAYSRALSDPRLRHRVSGVGRFEQRSGGALWAGVEPKTPVSELASKVDRACVAAGLEPERRAFHPHITLARWNRRSSDYARDFERRNADLKSEPFLVTSFILFESRLSRHGAYYEEIARNEFAQNFNRA